MIVTCKFNSGKDIPISERYLWETDQTDYSHLKVDENYFVFALQFILDRVDFLICPPEGNPSWEPGGLFFLSDTKIPPGWQFIFTQSSPGFSLLFDKFKIKNIMGYPLIVQSQDHYNGLIERDAVELERFFLEKIQLESWWESIDFSS